MASSPGIQSAEELYTAAERDSAKIALDLFGMAAKDEAFEHAQRTGMGPESRAEYLGGLVAALDQMSWSDRKTFADSMRAANEALGSVASANRVTLVLRPEPHADNEKVAFAASPPVSVEQAAEALSVEPAPDDTPNDEPVAKREIRLDAEPLSAQQRRWLGVILDEESVEEIANLSLSERIDFGIRLSNKYQSLTITRMSKATKKHRSEQLVAFMAGMSYQDIADLDRESSAVADGAGISQIAESIKKRRVDNKTIRSMIPGTPEEAEAQAAPPQLNEYQKEWIAKLLTEDDLEIIEALPVWQRLDFAAKLAAFYRELPVPKITKAGKKHRAEQMTAFMGGASFEEIAEMERGGSSRESVRNGLMTMTRSINRHADKATVRALIPKLKTPKSTLAAPALASSNPELLPDATEPLTNDQKKWYAKIFEDFESLESDISSLGPQQKDFLAELFGRRLNAALVRKLGITVTHRRLYQMALFMRGDTYEAIAEKVKLPIDKIKDELHRSTVVLKRKISNDELKIMLEQAKTKPNINQANGS